MMAVRCEPSRRRSHLAGTPTRLRHREIDIVDDGKEQYQQSCNEQHVHLTCITMTDHICSFGSLSQILLAQRYEITAHVTVLLAVQIIQRHFAQAFVYLRPLAFQAGSILA